jgi:hypothetical protein
MMSGLLLHEVKQFSLYFANNQDARSTTRRNELAETTFWIVDANGHEPEATRIQE